MKNLLKLLAGWGGLGKSAPAKPTLNLAAFGKHPGWDDHIPGIGLETEALARLKQSFYVSGIGGQIDSGAWEKLAPDKWVEGFSHTFLWRREGHLMLGRLWSSSDRKGRAKYPMVLCADSTGISPGFLLESAGQELEPLQNECRALTTAEPVVVACEAAQARLRARLEAAWPTCPATPIPAETRRRFLENPQFGENQVGLLRILHELSDLQSQPAKGRNLASGGSERSRHLRVPAIGQGHVEIFRIWLEFFQCAIPADIPLLLIWRDAHEWLDVIAGEPSGDEFFCLQATPLAAPLSTQIPYEIKPELNAQLQALTTRFLAQQTIPSHP